MKFRQLLFTGALICAVTGACGNGEKTAEAESKDIKKITPAAVTDVTWYEDWDKGVDAAKESGKPLYVHFTADWCTYCRKMKKETYADPMIKQRFNSGWITVSIDVENKAGKGTVYVNEDERKLLAYMDGDDASFAAQELDHKGLMSIFGGRGLPTLVFIDKTGQPIHMIPGYMPPEDFAVYLDYFKDEAYKDNIRLEDYQKQMESGS